MKAMIGSVVRAGLAAAAGWLVSKGAASADDAAAIVKQADTIAAGVVFAGTIGWSWWSKKKAVK